SPDRPFCATAEEAAVHPDVSIPFEPALQDRLDPPWMQPFLQLLDVIPFDPRRALAVGHLAPLPVDRRSLAPPPLPRVRKFYPAPPRLQPLEHGSALLAGLGEGHVMYRAYGPHDVDLGHVLEDRQAVDKNGFDVEAVSLCDAPNDLEI